MLDEVEDDPQVVACAACPRPFQLSFELVGLEPGIEGVPLEQLESCPETLGNRLGMLLEQAPRRANEGRGTEETSHDRRSSMSSSAVVGRQFPDANSWRAASTSSASCLRPRS